MYDEMELVIERLKNEEKLKEWVKQSNQKELIKELEELQIASYEWQKKAREVFIQIYCPDGFSPADSIHYTGIVYPSDAQIEEYKKTREALKSNPVITEVGLAECEDERTGELFNAIIITIQAPDKSGEILYKRI